MQVKIADSWKNILNDEFDKTYYKDLMDFVNLEYKNTTCYPQEKDIFAAFDFCAFNDVKVVVLGQDPYHGEGQANGLCFSVKDSIKQPPSLVNIFKEIKTDIGKDYPNSGNLERWAKQGVLLLNATLTVRANEAGSHQKKGWETFTDTVIKTISDQKKGVVFLLWGKFAQSKSVFIDTNKHIVFTAPHPSPLGAWRGWFGSKHFSKTNEVLKKQGKTPIDW
jgi:uracil-DNA glycosylase